MPQKLYKSLFWTGYLAVLVFAFLPIAGDISKIKIGPPSFKMQLDQLLHFVVYFLICMYYLFGKRMGFQLFRSNPQLKFVLAILLLATVTEFVQIWVPERSFNVFDWVANVSGIVVGVGVISRRLARRSLGEGGSRRIGRL